MTKSKEDLADMLKGVVDHFVEFKSLRDMSQEIAELETGLARELEGLLNDTNLNMSKFAARIANILQRVEGLRVDFEDFTDDAISMIDDLMWDVEV